MTTFALDPNVLCPDGELARVLAGPIRDGGLVWESTSCPLVTKTYDAIADATLARNSLVSDACSA